MQRYLSEERRPPACGDTSPWSEVTAYKEEDEKVPASIFLTHLLILATATGQVTNTAAPLIQRHVVSHASYTQRLFILVDVLKVSWRHGKRSVKGIRLLLSFTPELAGRQ